MNFSKVPTPLAGLALGISSLGLLWKNVYGFGGEPAAIVAGGLLSLLIAKYVLNPTLILSDLKHPILGSVFPTFCMALMVVSVSVSQYVEAVGLSIWLFAIVLHFTLFIIFGYFQSKNFNMKNVLPSWYIPPIGIVVSCVTFQHHLTSYEAFEPLAVFLLYCGFAFYAISLPLVLYRWLFLGEIPMLAKPTLGVLAAPASLTLAGYLSIERSINVDFMLWYVLLAIGMTLTLCFLLVKLLKLPFNPGMSAYTFPLVISATATTLLTNYLHANNLHLQIANALHYVSVIEIGLATAMVIYISIRYALHYSSSDSAR